MRSVAHVCLAAMLATAASCTSPTPPADTAKVDAKAKADAKKPDAKAKADVKNADAKDDEPAPTTAVTPPAPVESKTWSFDADPTGKPAPGLKISQTGELVTPPATWEVTTDDDAPSAPNVFGVTKTTGTNKTYNVALFEGSSYRDFSATVHMRALSGENNKGGGIVFRAKGDADYYVARWNPVESNFRLYVLVGGARVDITSVRLELEPTGWHSLKVVVKGDHFECFVDDRSVATALDKTLPDAGMIGLWAKGDAATVFDDLVVETSG
jgi:hypothetical protein